MILTVPASIFVVGAVLHRRLAPKQEPPLLIPSRYMTVPVRHERGTREETPSRDSNKIDASIELGFDPLDLFTRYSHARLLT